jgi:hypothetical protein
MIVNFSGQQTKTFVDAVDKYAQLGLRTLCLAWCELESEEYTEWSRLFKEANSALIDREVVVTAVYLLNINIFHTVVYLLNTNIFRKKLIQQYLFHSVESC